MDLRQAACLTLLMLLISRYLADNAFAIWQGMCRPWILRYTGCLEICWPSLACFCMHSMKTAMVIYKYPGHLQIRANGPARMDGSWCLAVLLKPAIGWQCCSYPGHAASHRALDVRTAEVWAMLAAEAKTPLSSAPTPEVSTAAASSSGASCLLISEALVPFWGRNSSMQTP